MTEVNARLFDIGLVCYGIGAFLLIFEEWRERGLSDTSFKSLLFLIAGPMLIAVEVHQRGMDFAALVAGSGGAVAAILFGLKLKDSIRNLLHRR